jgi:uncharacterized protein with HEPN domain
LSRRDEVSLKDYLEHIQQASTRIQKYLSDVDRAAFLVNEEKQDAVIRNLEIIGEASGNILRYFPDFSESHPELPLKMAYGTRNALAHGYFKVDLHIVWKTVERDLPLLDARIKELLERLY